MSLKKILDYLVGPEIPEEKTEPPKPKEEPKPPPTPPPPPPQKIKTPEEDLQLEMKSPYVREILKRFFIPYREEFDSQNATEGFLLLAEFLDREGDCPSVVRRSKEPVESVLTKLSPLHKITLKEHSLHVAYEILNLLKERNPKDFHLAVPEAVILALAHDLGKIPSLRDPDSYIKADHPYLSALKLKEIFPNGQSPRWIEHSREIIRGHHRHSPNFFLANLLREADRRARESEILMFHPELKPKPPRGWPDPKKILRLIGPQVDKLQAKNKFSAFSHESIIFIQPDALYEAAKKLAIEEKILWWDLILESEKRKVIIEIIDSLRNEKMLAEDIPYGDYGRICEIEFSNRTVPMKLVPVKIEAFGELPSKISRSSKHGYLAEIRSVKMNPLRPWWRRWPAS